MSAAATATTMIRPAPSPCSLTPEARARWPKSPGRGDRRRLARALICACCLEAATIAGAWRLDRHLPNAAHEPERASVALVFSPPTEPAALPTVEAPPPESVPAESVPPVIAAPQMADTPAPEPPTATPPAEPVPLPEAEALVPAVEPPLPLRASPPQAPSPVRRTPTAQPRRVPREEFPLRTQDAVPAQQAAPIAAPPVARPVSARPQPSAGEVATFEGRLREAVQAALRYPAAARMMGVTGRARVAFAYRDGAVDGIGVAQSAGTPMLDAAALAAVRAAHYPRPPDAIAGQTLRLLVWVDFLPGQDGD